MARRIKILFLGVMAFTISVLIYSSHLRQTHVPDQRSIQDFYYKTKTALDKKPPAGGAAGAAGAGGVPLPNENVAPLVVDLDDDGDVDEDDARLAREMAERLRAAEQQAKDQANAKAPNKPDAPKNIVGVGSSAGGQHGIVAGQESEAEHAVEEEINSILKRAPVIIFSKTYCPYSKRAKTLLLERYTIEPAPIVIEIDKHPMGAALQAKLAVLTGRSTVPNILVSGKSIGGGDDIAALHSTNELVSTVKGLAGKHVAIKLRPSV